MEDNDEIMGGGEEEKLDLDEQKLINEEYKVWKKNSPFLYDLLYSRALDWPTLTTQWFPDVKEVAGNGKIREHRLLFGTNTSGKGQEYLQIAQLQIPSLDVPEPVEFNDQTGEIGGHGAARRPFQFEIHQRINHPGEVNKARYMPQNPNLIASLCPDGRVLVFDRTKHPLQPKDDRVLPQMELRGHTDEGFGMSWSPLIEGHLATASQDHTVRLWDITAYNSKQDTWTTEAKTVFTHHRSVVNDVEFHPKQQFLLGSVSDDLTLQLLDMRKHADQAAIKSTKAHSDAVNCIAFHPKWDYIVATGSADCTVAMWDLRAMGRKLHSIAAHRDSVIKVEWHPQEPAILASASYDRRICMCDLSRAGEEQTEEEAEDGPPELIFMHGGFTNRVGDFSWNKNDPWVMLAAAEDNLVQCFRPARSLVNASPEKSIPMRDVEE